MYYNYYNVDDIIITSTRQSRPPSPSTPAPVATLVHKIIIIMYYNYHNVDDIIITSTRQSRPPRPSTPAPVATLVHKIMACASTNVATGAGVNGRGGRL